MPRFAANLSMKYTELGYSGHIGCEHGPHAGTSARLGWFQRYKESQR